MKKIVVFLSLILFLSAAGIAQAQDITVSQIKNSDVEVFSDDNKFGIKDKKGNILVPAEYKKLVRVGDTSWITLKGSRYGLMDNEGNFLIKPKYRHVERILLKYVKFGNDNDYGLYDETGKAIIQPEFSSIEPLFGQMFLTCKNYKYFFF